MPVRSASRKAIQLTIACEDRPGTLSKLAKLLGEKGVDITAMSCAPVGVQGYIHLVVDNEKRAKKALAREHISFTEQEVLEVDLPNLPGCLGAFAEKLAQQNINITTAYGSASKGSRKTRIIFKVSDLQKAAKIRW